MADIALYFQAHQPNRLRWISAFDLGNNWFDRDRDAAILDRVATRCYRPALGLLLDLVARGRAAGEKFCFSLSVSGTLLRQWQVLAPDLIHLTAELVRTGGCELLAETSHHSLAALAPGAEFETQVRAHLGMVASLVGLRPRVLRNTELIYSDSIAARATAMTDSSGVPLFDGMLAEGVDVLLAGRPVDAVYESVPSTDAHACRPLPLLLRNHGASDEIAFGFQGRGGRTLPLTPEDLAQLLSNHTAPPGRGVHLVGIDLETFGEHVPAAMGIFDFLEALPAGLVGRHRFVTPSCAILERADAPKGRWSSPTPTSWADAARDVSAWLGNPMQREAFELHAQAGRALELAERAAELEGANSIAGELAELRESWRRLSTSDHFYWMSTKAGDDGRVHDYFRAYDSPYDAFVNYANVLGGLRRRVRGLAAAGNAAGAV